MNYIKGINNMAIEKYIDELEIPLSDIEEDYLDEDCEDDTCFSVELLVFICGLLAPKAGSSGRRGPVMSCFQALKSDKTGDYRTGLSCFSGCWPLREDFFFCLVMIWVGP